MNKRNIPATRRPREDVYKWVRENPDITATDVREKLLSMRDNIISQEDDSFDIDSHYYVPSIQNISRNWVPQAKESLQTEEVRELLKPYSPIVTHNSPFWKGKNNLYTFTSDDKLMLLNVYNQLKEVWFTPLEINENELTVNQAMWICILANAVDELKFYPVDLFLMSNYFATKYLTGLQTNKFDVGVPPTETVDKSDMDYLLNLPYQSPDRFRHWQKKYETSHTENLNRLVSQDGDWFFLLSQKYNTYNDKWFVDFPMNWASQLHSMHWLPPFQRVQFILGTFLMSYILLLDSKYFEYRNHEWADTMLVYLQNFRDNLMTHRTRNEYGVVPVVFDDKNKELDKINIKFNATHFDRYMKLLVSLDRLNNTEPLGSHVGLKVMTDFGSTKFLNVTRKYTGWEKPMQFNYIAEMYPRYTADKALKIKNKLEANRKKWGIADRVPELVNPVIYKEMMTTALDIPVSSLFFEVETTTSVYTNDDDLSYPNETIDVPEPYHYLDHSRFMRESVKEVDSMDGDALLQKKIFDDHMRQEGRKQGGYKDFRGFYNDDFNDDLVPPTKKT